WALARPRRVALFGALVILSSAPLYAAIHQEYVPSNVDEAEFEVMVVAPEGTSIAAMDEGMRAVDAEIRATPGVRTVLTTIGVGFLEAVNQGLVFVRIAPHEERSFSLSRFFGGLFRGDPLAAWHGNQSQSELMQGLRKRLARFSDFRISVRNAPSFN